MKNLARILAVSCVAAAMHSQADGLDDFITSLDEVATDAEDATGSLSSLDDRKEEKPSGKADQSKPFYLMPFCRNLEGKAEVMIPGKAWEPIQEGKYYPLGTRYRTIGASSRLKIIFGFESEVSIVGEVTFGTIAMPAGEKSRAITLVSGVINVKVPNNLSEGLFSVNAPGFVVCNLAGESSYTYNKVGDGDEAIVNCVTKSLSVKGRNFEIPSMRAANKVRIVTSQDNLVTAIYGMSGDIMTKLDQGRILVKDYGIGQMIYLLGIVAHIFIGYALGAHGADSNLRAVLKRSHLGRHLPPHPYTSDKRNNHHNESNETVAKDKLERALVKVVEAHEEGLGLAVEPPLLLATLENLGGKHGCHGEGGKG